MSKWQLVVTCHLHVTLPGPSLSHSRNTENLIISSNQFEITQKCKWFSDISLGIYAVQLNAVYESVWMSDVVCF